MQMVQFPSLEQCKQAFREHMADAQWVFHCESDEQPDIEGLNSKTVQSHESNPAQHIAQRSAFQEALESVRNGTYKRFDGLPAVVPSKSK